MSARRGCGVISCSPRVPPPAAPAPTLGSVRSTGGSREGQGCPQCPLPSLGRSSTDGLSLEYPRTGCATPSSILRVPRCPGHTLSCNPVRTGIPGVPRGSLRVLSHRRACGTQEAEVTSEGPCRCPQVAVLSHTAGQGAGVGRCPGGAVCSALGGFYSPGLDRSRRRLAGHGRVTNTCGPASHIPAAFTCPGEEM